jgi:hypothetical protein
MAVVIIFTPLVSVMKQLYHGSLTSYFGLLLGEIFSTSDFTFSLI